MDECPYFLRCPYHKMTCLELRSKTECGLLQIVKIWLSENKDD